LDFSVAGFLPSSTFGFWQEMIVPAVTATSIALRRDLESFMYLNYGIPEYIGDSNIFRNVADDIKINYSRIIK
jgi:hypothetical protein